MTKGYRNPDQATAIFKLGPKRGTLTTLHEAHTYMLALKGGRERRGHWQRAAALLMEAAEGGDVEAVASQIEFALIMDGALAL